MKTQLLRQLIREEIKAQINSDELSQGKEQAQIIKTISKALNNQKSNFELISTKEHITDLMGNIFNMLKPGFKESPMFKQAIKAIYDKYYTK